MDLAGNHVEFQSLPKGYKWTLNTVDEYIVGRIHGGWSTDEILRYIPYSHESLFKITAAELESFWNDILALCGSRVAFWEAKNHQHPEVQRVLNRIRALVLPELGF